MPLALTASLLVASAAHRTSAGSVEVDEASYGGTTTGGWTCGPTGRARYAGVGTNLNLSARDRRDKDGPGWRGAIGAALEQESIAILHCASLPCSRLEPSAQRRWAAMGGLQGRGGYWGKYAGIDAGLVAFQLWENEEMQRPAWMAWPQLELQFGRPSTGYFVFGTGSHLPNTLRRPGVLYLGAGGAWEVWGLDIRMGINRVGPATDARARVDAVARISLAPGVFLCPGFAFNLFESFRPNESSLEGALGARFNL